MRHFNKIAARIAPVVLTMSMLSAPVYAEDYTYDAPNVAAQWDHEEGTNIWTYDDPNTADAPDITLVKDGDTWTYRFAVEQIGTTYYAYEDDENMEATYDEITGNVFAPISFTPTAEEVAAGVGTAPSSIINKISTVEEPEYGTLKITKDVLDSEAQDIEDNTSFTYTVTLKNSSGNPIPGANIYSGIAFTNGVARVTVSENSSVTLEGLPVGTTYEVVETVTNGYDIYTIDGNPYDASENNKSSGTIAANTESTAAFQNKKKPEVPRVYNSFTLAKAVSGRYEVADTEYEFLVSLTGLDPEESYTIDKTNATLTFDGTYTADADGNANVTVKLLENESVVFQNLPVDALYKVTELAGPFRATYTVVDAQGLGHIISSNGENPSENKLLSTATEVVNADEEVTVTFNNIKEVTEPLTITKTVTNVVDDRKFTITVEFRNLGPETIITSDQIGRVIADEDGNASIDLYIGHNETVTFNDLPVGAQYRVTEPASGYISSYQMTNAGSRGTIVKASDKLVYEVGEAVTQDEKFTVYNKATSEPLTDSTGRAITFTVRPDSENGNALRFYVNRTTKPDTLTFALPEDGTLTLSVNGTTGAVSATGASNLDFRKTDLLSSWETVNEDEEVTAAFTNQPITISISGSKTWDDNNNSKDTRPTSIVVNLLRNDKVYKTTTVTPTGGNWNYQFNDLLKYDSNGNLFVYTVSEETAGYDTTYLQGANEATVPTEGHYNIKNTLQVTAGSIVILKTDADPIAVGKKLEDGITYVIIDKTTGKPLLGADGYPLTFKVVAGATYSLTSKDEAAIAAGGTLVDGVYYILRDKTSGDPILDENGDPITFKAEHNRTYTFTTQGGDTITVTIGADGTVSGTGLEDIVFKNKMAGVTFTVTIDANGKATVSGIDDVSFKKTLTGAEFTLYDRTTNQPVLDSEGNAVKFTIGAPGTVSTVTLADGTVLTVTVRSDGSVLVEGMPEGSYYLKETKAPGGFFLSDETQNFNVTPGEITSVDVDDKKLQVLPGTGGPGVLVFILAGAGMMAGAVIWFKKNKKDTQLSW